MKVYIAVEIQRQVREHSNHATGTVLNRKAHRDRLTRLPTGDSTVGVIIDRKSEKPSKGKPKVPGTEFRFAFAAGDC
jgi:hypothetical protein